jgi:hypothetical protein
MNNTITEENLILFIYGELGEFESDQIKSSLLVDIALQEKHKQLLSVVRELDTQCFEPHDTSLKIILEESALSHWEKIC